MDIKKSPDAQIMRSEGMTRREVPSEFPVAYIDPTNEEYVFKIPEGCNIKKLLTDASIFDNTPGNKQILQHSFIFTEDPSRPGWCIRTINKKAPHGSQF